MTVFLLVLAGLLILAIVASFICFCIAFVRVRPVDISKIKAPEGSELAFYQPQMRAAKEAWKAVPFEEVTIQSYDGLSLYGKLYLHPQAERTILMMHGYRGIAENDFGCGLDFYYRVSKSNVLMVDQRAHGKSRGRLITFGIRERFDCRDWAFFASKKCGANLPLYVAGVSMGASTVMMAAGLELPDNVCGLIADCGYTSPEAIIKKVIERELQLPVKLCMAVLRFWFRIIVGVSLNSVSTLDTMAHCRLPIFFAHGTADTFVPCHMTEENYAACASPLKRLLLVEGADHGLSFLKDQPTYMNEISNFFKDTQAQTRACSENTDLEN